MSLLADDWGKSDAARRDWLARHAALHDQLLHQSNRVQVEWTDIKYDQTAAEAALGVTPTDYYYPADPYADPRRYGADATGVSDSTTAVQTALNVAYKAKGLVWIGNECNFLCGALTVTFSGNHSNDGLRIMGSSINGSRLTAYGSPATLLTLAGSTPTSSASEAPLVIENLTLSGTTASDGLLLNGIAYWTLRNVYLQGFNRNLYLYSALTGTVEDCGLFSGNYGLYARTDGAGAGPNLVTVRNCIIDSNATWGIDFGGGDRFKVESCDMEGNGTSANTSTGALIIRSTVNTATGYATIDLDGVWFESNLGQTMSVESTSGLTLAIRNTNWYSDESGNSLLIAGGTRVSIEDSMAPSGSAATWDITCNNLFLKNVIVHTLTDASIYPFYANVQTSAGFQNSGREDNSVTLTLTGCTTSPTVNPTIIQQGYDITVYLGAGFTGTSNATACTMTGLPAKYQPAADQTVPIVATDNGASAIVSAALTPSSGTITLDHTFTNSGAKGVQAGCCIRYRLAA